ncbi:hypothetical protein [Atlantibacter sp.]|uniref:hypothetical protein n=1 Tax=Atlantibacter sp. TaxID=1903473 RepID=UPI00289F0B5A|nr:hypothetical protein [Atlantibacter sp.]
MSQQPDVDPIPSDRPITDDPERLPPEDIDPLDPDLPDIEDPDILPKDDLDPDVAAIDDPDRQVRPL